MPEYIPLGTQDDSPQPHKRSRRLVTGVNADGQSYFAVDDQSPHLRTVANCPEFVMTDYWRSEQTPVDNRGSLDDGITPDVTIPPSATGSVFRHLQIPPDSVWKTSEEVARALYHSTASLDYAIVLEGEIYAVLDADERKMVAGDVLIQRGTNHGWYNRSDKPCSMIFVLIGGNEAH